MNGKFALYNVMALATIVVWGLTFISTKVLIYNGLNPVEIFIIRFSMAYFCTLLFCHGRLWANNMKDELLMLATGVTGGSLYFIAENTALEFTFASNVSLIICCAPIFTIILGKSILKDKIKKLVWIGSIIAFVGVGIVVLNGSGQYGINPLGDFLTVIAALSWAVYCLLLKRLNTTYSNMFITRKVFAYGVITAVLYHIINPTESHFVSSELNVIIWNLLFLGVGASFVCYLMWNAAVRNLGAERTSNYIYFVPLVTIIASVVLLNEPFTVSIGAGTALVISGVILSTK